MMITQTVSLSRENPENRLDEIYHNVRSAVIKANDKSSNVRNLRHKALLIIANSSTEENSYTIDRISEDLGKNYGIESKEISLYGIIGNMQRDLFKYVGRVKGSSKVDTKAHYFFRTNKGGPNTQKNFIEALGKIEKELY